MTFVAVPVASVRLRLVAEVDAVMMGRLIGGMLDEVRCGMTFNLVSDKIMPWES